MLLTSLLPPPPHPALSPSSLTPSPASFPLYLLRPYLSGPAGWLSPTSGYGSEEYTPKVMGVSFTLQHCLTLYCQSLTYSLQILLCIQTFEDRIHFQCWLSLALIHITSRNMMPIVHRNSPDCQLWMYKNFVCNCHYHPVLLCWLHLLLCSFLEH